MTSTEFTNLLSAGLPGLSRVGLRGLRGAFASLQWDQKALTKCQSVQCDTHRSTSFQYHSSTYCLMDRSPPVVLILLVINLQYCTAVWPCRSHKVPVNIALQQSVVRNAFASTWIQCTAEAPQHRSKRIRKSQHRMDLYQIYPNISKYQKEIERILHGFCQSQT